MLDQRLITKCCQVCGVPSKKLTDKKCEWCARQRSWYGLVDLVLIGSFVVAIVIISIAYNPL